MIAVIFPFICLLTANAFQQSFPRKSCISNRYRAVEMVFEYKSFKKGVEEKMTKSVDNLQSQLNTLRAGQARYP